MSKLRCTLPGAALLGTLFLSAATPAGAGVVSFAEYINGNVNAATIGGFESHTSTLSESMLTTDIGFANATVHTARGAMAGQAVVSMEGTEFVGATLRARAQAFTVENLHFGTDYCVNSECRSALSLGVTALNIGFSVHASGGVSAFATNTQFDRAHASVSYGYALTNGVGFTTSGGGVQERSETGGVSGGIGSVTASLAVRPGDTLELQMSLGVFAEAAISPWRHSGFTSTHVLADADFSHTLLWDGITDITAFDANGDIVALTPGGRFQLLNDAGDDFWFASPGFVNAPASVPEPETLALTCLALAGLCRRQARRRGMASSAAGGPSAAPCRRN